MSMRPFEKLPTIRAKLGSVIVFAVGLTVALVYFLLGFALRNSFRDADLVELLRLAQTQSRSDAFADDVGLDEAKRLLVARLAEEPLARSEDDREDHHAQLVDEVVLDQRLHELGAAVDDDVGVDIVLELGDLGRDVALEHGGVVPLGLVERRGDDVLRHRVELVGELALAPGPGVGEAFVGAAPDQEAVGRHRLLELELVAVVAAVELEAPAGVIEVLATRRLHHSVHRDELRHDDSRCHLRPPCDRVRVCSHSIVTKGPPLPTTLTWL